MEDNWEESLGLSLKGIEELYDVCKNTPIIKVMKMNLEDFQ